MTDRLPPRAVFCYSERYEIHAGIHLETEHCTSPVSAYETMKPSFQEIAAELAQKFKYDAEHGDEIARKIFEKEEAE